MGGSILSGKVCLVCSSETIRFRKLISGREIGWVGRYRCAKFMCGLDLTYDFAVVTLSVKILSELYLGICRVQEVVTL